MGQGVSAGARAGRSNLQQLGDPGFYSDVRQGIYNKALMPYNRLVNRAWAGASDMRGHMQRDWQGRLDATNRDWQDRLDAVQNQPYNLTFRDRFRRQIPGDVRYGN